MRSFSLIELIVTLGLLVIIAAGVFGFYVNGIRAGQHAQGLAVASALAQARIEMLKSEPLPYVLPGGSEPGAARIPGYTEGVEVSELSRGLRQFDVTVFWTWRGQARQTTLTTIVAEPEAP
ncbi:MAG: hypothetical protein ACRDF5_11880 [bacterium]